MAKRLGKRERAKKLIALRAKERQARDVLPEGQYASAGSRILENRAIGSPKIDWSFRKRTRRNILTVP